MKHLQCSILSQGTIILFYSIFGNFGELDLATFKIEWRVNICTKENQAADFEGKGTYTYEHLQETLALNNTTVVIMKLKCAAVLCVC